MSELVRLAQATTGSRHPPHSSLGESVSTEIRAHSYLGLGQRDRLAEIPLAEIPLASRPLFLS